MIHRFYSLSLVVTATLMVASMCSAQVVITHFHADINEGNVISQGVVGTGATATGVGDFVLTQVMGDPNATTLSYAIQLTGIDLDGAQTPDILDNVAAVHLHDVTQCSPVSPQCQPGDTALTQHVLNIYGAPRLDDGDLVVDPIAGTLNGLWDVSDTNLTFPPTRSIADPEILNLLFSGNIHFMLHTNGFPSGAIGGQLAIVPEPASALSAAVGMAVIFGLGARRRPMRNAMG